jgi:osmoprotectant transport system permease protein
MDWDWVAGHVDDIVASLTEHVLLTVIAVVGGFAIAFVLTLLVRRIRWLTPAVTFVAGTLYTIPSLALFALLVPITGFTLLTAEIGLIGYTLLILIRNLLAGLDGVPSDVTEAARGMGYTSRALLWRVELPLALPVIVAGIRIATVTTIGLVTVTALIGQGGLGQQILLGFQLAFPTRIYVGAGLSIGLAILADTGLLLAQRALTPWARSRARVA